MNNQCEFKIVTTAQTDWNNFYTVQVTKGGSRIAVNSYPFGNCQNFSIGYFDAIVYNYTPEEIFDKIQEVKELCKISKPFLIVDLNQATFEKIEKQLKMASITKYTNPNGSSMVLCIIDTRRKPE